jgi:cyclophilin family peptidyl-prolyl cis-trans isomerase
VNAALLLSLLLPVVQLGATPRLTAPEAAAVGDAIRLLVAIEGDSESPLTLGGEAFDERAFDFDVRHDEGEIATYSRRLAEAPPRLELARGQRASLEIEIPALAAGRLEVTPYCRVAGQRVRGESRVIAIAPAEDGGVAMALAVTTDRGELRIELDPRRAPAVCLHVAALAQGGAYDDLPIDRVIEGSLLRVASGSGAIVPLDASPLPHVRGAVSLLRRGVPGESLASPSRAGGSDGSFAVLLSDEPFLDGRYAVFGKIGAGLELAQTLAGEPLERDARGELSRPKRPARVESVRLVRGGAAAAGPESAPTERASKP